MIESDWLANPGPRVTAIADGLSMADIVCRN